MVELYFRRKPLDSRAGASLYRLCAVVPVYNHTRRLAQVVGALRDYDLTVYIVDDGSEERNREYMEQLVTDSVRLVCHTENLGKGAAVKSGFKQAMRDDFTHAIQIDADGQHDISDIPGFIQCSKSNPKALVNGFPRFDESVPRARYWGRYLTHVWVWINTLSLSIPDSMCGFRLYPLVWANDLTSSEKIGDRMDFDIEFIVRWFWRDYPIKHIKTRVIYHEDEHSNFRLLQDNALITRMHCRLFFGMLIRLPSLLARHWRQEGPH